MCTTDSSPVFAVTDGCANFLLKNVADYASLYLVWKCEYSEGGRKTSIDGQKDGISVTWFSQTIIFKDIDIRRRDGELRTFIITKRVCSNWALRLPSAVTAVHPSGHIRSRHTPVIRKLELNENKKKNNNKRQHMCWDQVEEWGTCTCIDHRFDCKGLPGFHDTDRFVSLF